MSWEKVNISDVSTQIRGVSYKPIDVSIEKNERNYPVLRANNIEKYGLTFNDLVFVDNKRISEKQLLKEGDILIAASSGSKEIVGKAAIVNKKMTASFGAFCKVIRPNSKVDVNFIGYYFQSPDYRRTISHLSAGANINNLRSSDLDNLQIPLPPLPIQKAIAAKLDKADALRKKDQELLKQYDELAQSVFIEMFGDPVKNEKGWELKKLEDLMRIRRGASPRPIDKYIGDDINWIKIGDATTGDEIFLNECKVKITKEGAKKSVFLEKGSLIFANCGVSLGFCRILNLDGCIHDGWLSFDQIEEDLLDKMFFLKSVNFITEYFRRMAPEGTQPNLNTGIMKNFYQILPPLGLQKKFVVIIENIEQQKQKVKQQAVESENLFQALLQESFE